jgi:mono/diheme cytochrome c family protein
MALVVAGLMAVGCQSRRPEPEWGRALALTVHLKRDYVEAVEANRPEEFDELHAIAQELVDVALRLGTPALDLIPRLRRLSSDIASRAPPLDVYNQTSAVVADLVRLGKLPTMPPAPPSIERGKAIYETNCSVCHGTEAGFRGEVAREMRPSPPDFHESDVMNPLIPFESFYVVSHGFGNTPMPSFELLSEQGRWDAVFYLFRFRQPPCEQSSAQASLRELSTLSDSELVARHHEAGAACLRRGGWLPRPELETVSR